MGACLGADELYRYLHISKRKLKFLLENDYIPCIDTGKKTHRFLIKVSDAKDLSVEWTPSRDSCRSYTDNLTRVSTSQGRN